MNASDWPLWRYRATVTRIIDGDTVECSVDAGFRLYATKRIRILGYDAPELFSGTDRENGAAARGYLESLIPIGTRVYLETQKDRTTFDRYLADVWVEQDGQLTSVAAAMKQAGYDLEGVSA